MKYIKQSFLLAFCSVLIGSAQQFQKAVVTDVNYCIQPGMTVIEKFFPFYFHYPEFIADIHSDIQKYVKENFDVDTVIFQDTNKVFYTQSIFIPKIYARDQAKKSSEKNTIFIGVETILREGVVINQISTYHWTTRVKVYRGGGKNVYSFRNIIPFETFIDEEISDNIKIKERDFYAFYFDGLKMAFEGDVQRVEKRYIEQPLAKYYYEYRNISEKFYLVQGYQSFNYGSNMNDLKEVLNYKSLSQKKIYAKPQFSNNFEGDYVQYGFGLQNYFTGQEYTLKINGGKTTLQSFITEGNDIRMEFYDDTNKDTGKFYYNTKDTLSGNFEDRYYKAQWNHTYDVMEIYCDEEMVLLIKYASDRKILFVRNNVTEKILGELFNIIFAYDFALEAKIDALY